MIYVSNELDDVDIIIFGNILNKLDKLHAASAWDEKININSAKPQAIKSFTTIVYPNHLSDSLLIIAKIWFHRTFRHSNNINISIAYRYQSLK